VHWQADEYGYLVASPYVTVTRNPGYIEILPVDPAYIYVPVYDPLVVFARSVRGVVVTAITWGPTVFIGTWFAPFGWAKAGFIWHPMSFRLPGNRGTANGLRATAMFTPIPGCAR